MRHSVNKVFSAMAIAIVAAACAKDPVQPQQAGPRDFSFNCASGELTKTAIAEKNNPDDGAAIVWVSGDAVSVFDATGANCEFVTSESGNPASFSGTMTPFAGAGTYYAVYPYLAGNALSGTTVTTTLPSDQKVSGPGVAPKANIAAGKTGSTSIQFANITGLLRFTVPADVTDLKKVTIEAREEGAYLAGTFGIDLSSSAPALGAVSAGEKSVTLSAEDGGALAAGNYYVAVLPGTYTLDVTLENTAGVTAVRSTESAITLASSHIKALGSVKADTFTPVSDIYVTPAGAGAKTGASWADACDVAGLKAAIASATTGTTIYLGAGSYVIADPSTHYCDFSYASATKIAFKGGYDAATGARDVAANESILSGNNEHAIVAAGANADLSFDGVSFANALAIQDGELVKTVRGALSVNDASAKVTLENCIFKDNVEAGNGINGISSGQEGGSAIFMTTGAVYAHNCLFIGNKSGSRGGAIRTDGNTGLLFMDNCHFYGNGMTREAYGRVAFTKSNFCINKCVFHGDFADAAPGKNDPTLNINFNNIIVNCEVIEEAKFSGTGVIRSETKSSDNYTSVIMNNVVVNEYIAEGTTGICSMLLSQVGLVSAGYNLLVAQNKIKNASNITLQDTDKSVASLGDYGSYTYNPSTYSFTWTDFTFTKATASQVETAVRAITPTKGIATLGADFADWVASIGSSF